MTLQDEHTQTKTDAQAFLTLSGEKILVAKRKHWITIFLPLGTLGGVGLLGLVTICSIFFIFPILRLTPILTAALSITLTSLIVSLAMQLVIAWYFRLYIITNHKILQISYTPLGRYWSNSILLDQVRCTEIDIQTNGIVNQLLNKGSIVITFDRPTHEEEFMLNDIKDPRKTGAFLADIFETQDNEKNDNVLYTPRKRFFNPFRTNIQTA